VPASLRNQNFGFRVPMFGSNNGFRVSGLGSRILDERHVSKSYLNPGRAFDAWTADWSSVARKMVGIPYRAAIASASEKYCSFGIFGSEVTDKVGNVRGFDSAHPLFRFAGSFPRLSCDLFGGLGCRFQGRGFGVFRTFSAGIHDGRDTSPHESPCLMCRPTIPPKGHDM